MKTQIAILNSDFEYSKKELLSFSLIRVKPFRNLREVFTPRGAKFVEKYEKYMMKKLRLQRKTFLGQRKMVQANLKPIYEIAQSAISKVENSKQKKLEESSDMKEIIQKL